MSHLVIDALDECETDLPELLRFINHTSSSCRVKWILSSRNEPHIERGLRLRESGTRLELELKENAEQVSRAVDAYIDHCISDLSVLQDDQTLQYQVRHSLRHKADGTFLWVALVFQELQHVESWDVLEVLKEIPAGLEALYHRMMQQINQLERRNPEFCRSVLSTVTIAYRPLHLEELGILSGLPSKVSIEKIASMCGSFLTIRDKVVYFVPQSAKDYLMKDPNSDILSKIFPAGYAEAHRTIVSRSLEAMLTTLQRDIYNLKHPSFPIKEIKFPDPDALAPIRYACVYWIDHLCETESSHNGVGFYDEEKIDEFWRKHFLHWLEALSLMRSTSNSVFAIARLIGLLTVSYYLTRAECLQILIDPESLI